MGLPPIKLSLGGEELHLVDTRELDRWGGYLNARRGAFELVAPDNVAAVRTSLLVPPGTDSEGVFTELRKQLEDGSALFFEIPPAPVRFDTPAHTNLIDLHFLLGHPHRALVGQELPAHHPSARGVFTRRRRSHSLGCCLGWPSPWPMCVPRRRQG